jgi:hypothetical protein
MLEDPFYLDQEGDDPISPLYLNFDIDMILFYNQNEKLTVFT